MTRPTYSPSSPYFATGYRGDALGVLSYRNIPARRSDVLHTIVKVHEYRPDLLAYDLYGDSDLWWVFAVRNPNVLKDPLWDFRSGTKIFVPKQSTIQEALGL